VQLHWEVWLEGLGHIRQCRHCQGELVIRKAIVRDWQN
jgi:hypothetical protein